jgi:nicotinamidase-related amidase
MVLGEAESSLENIQKLLASFRSKQRSVYHIIHESPKELGFLVKGTEGALGHPSLKPFENENVIYKTRPNSFLNTDLLEKLKSDGIESLVIVGFMANFCIDSTVRAAKDLGFEVKIVSEAIAASACPQVKLTDLQIKQAFLGSLCTVFAEVLSVEEVCKG